MTRSKQAQEALDNYMKPDDRPFTFDITKIRPMFYHFGSTVHCSCYMTIENKAHIRCPYYKQTATNCPDHQCEHGGGTMDGNWCGPYYRYLHRIGKFDENLAKLYEIFLEDPEWHGCKLTFINENGKREIV